MNVCDLFSEVDIDDENFNLSSCLPDYYNDQNNVALQVPYKTVFHKKHTQTASKIECNTKK